MSQARRVLVTGGTGFIGRHLIGYLTAQGHEVTALQRSSEHLAGVVETITVTDLSPNTVTRALAGHRFDWLFHLAGYGVIPTDRAIGPMFGINVDVTRQLVQEAASWPARAVVVAGSGSEYDLTDVDAPVTEDHRLEAFKLYGASKAAGTLTALSVARHLELPLGVGRIFGVFGPGEPAHRLLPSLVRGLRSGHRVPLSEGRQRRDFLFVQDVVTALDAIARLLETEPGQLVLNVATGQPVSVRRFAEMVALALDAPLSLLGFGDLPMRPDDTRCFSGDPMLLTSRTGWIPRHELGEGIRCGVLNSQTAV
jgi:UDP-glucose 4-epimerase